MSSEVFQEYSTAIVGTQFPFLSKRCSESSKHEFCFPGKCNLLTENNRSPSLARQLFGGVGREFCFIARLCGHFWFYVVLFWRSQQFLSKYLIWCYDR
eukprot:3784217-Amphidinium_carterae.1